MRSLLAEVQAFDSLSRASHYYESFNVNSRNYRDKSQGTREFITECDRLWHARTDGAWPAERPATKVAGYYEGNPLKGFGW